MYTKEDKKKLKELKELEYKLRYKLDNIKWAKLYSNYWKENKEEEKKHRVFCPDDFTPPLTIGESASLFAVHQIVKYVLGLECWFPDTENYLHIRKSCFTAFALAVQYTDEIIECLEGFDIEEILKLDYAKIQSIE